MMQTPPSTTEQPVAPSATPADIVRRTRLIVMGVLAGLVGLLFLVLPALYRAHYEFLLWAEGYMERAFAEGFISGQFQRLIETPKPLWSLFWLLADTPNKLYILICVLIALVFYLFERVSDKLTGAYLFGILAFALTVFGFRDVLELLLNGSWTIPFMLLGLLFLFSLLTKRWNWALVAVGLAGLIRPEAWFLAVYYVVYLAFNREKLRWFHFLPLLAPLLWMAYDFRLSGDVLYSYRNTATYAVITGVRGVNFISFWRHLFPDIMESTGVIALFYAVVGMVFRFRSVARESRARGSLRALLDPLLAVTWLPLLASWAMSLPGDIIIMRRFFFFSIGLMALYGLLAPFEILRGRRVAARGMLTAALMLPLLLAGLIRFAGKDGISISALRMLKVTESKMAAIEGLAAELQKPEAELDEYRYIIIPFRRYAQFTAFTTPGIYRRFISYRELSLAVTSTQYTLLGEEITPPRGSSQLVRDLIMSRKQFRDFLPALALWVPDDEMHYIDAFAFDDPAYFHRNYIDKGRYGFRIVGEALDSLGLIYDVREIEPEMIRDVIPPPPDSSSGARFGVDRISPLDGPGSTAP